MIRLFLVSCVAICLGVLPASADPRSLYTVRDIAVDEQAESVIVAQQNAFAAARLAGLQLMLDKITLPEDLVVIGDLSFDQVLADRLAAAVDVQEEVRGGGRYRGVLSVVFNRANVRAFLAENEIAFVDRQAPFSLAVPIVAPGTIVELPEPEQEPEELAPDTTGIGVGIGTFPADPTEAEPAFVDEGMVWRMAWGERNDGALAHYATTQFEYDTQAQWVDVQEDVLENRARRAVLAILRGRPSAYVVEISTITPAGKTPVGTTYPALTVEDAAKAASAMLDEAWKEQSVVRSGERTSVEASVFYTSLAEWNSLRGALSRSPLVSSFRINAIASDGAVVSFAFAGDTNRLILDLRQRGVALDVDPGGWVLTSAVTAAPSFDSTPIDPGFDEGPL